MNEKGRDHSDIAGLYGQCPHCKWSVKAESGQETVLCESCGRMIKIVDGQFVVPGTGPPTRTLQQNQSTLIGWLVAVVIILILAIIYMSGRPNNPPAYTPVGTGSDPGRPAGTDVQRGDTGRTTSTDVRNNTCYRACAARMTSHPDDLAPQCSHVTPASEYEKCISGAAESIADLCLKECGLK